MYKVLLVDDEYFPREALKTTIPWEEYGCEICGEAKNGIDAIEKATELVPDIILTDINMPGMDGLDMITHVQEKLPDVLFCIVTGYGEFEYAKRGIELGVKDFIVKPVDDQKLISTVQQLVESLDKRKKKKQEFESLKFWAVQNNEENKKNFLDMLLTGEREISEEQFLYECGQLDIPLQSAGYVVCCLDIDSRTYVRLNWEEWQKKIEEIVGQMKQEWIYTVYYKGNCRLYLIFSNIIEEEWNPMMMQSLLQKIQIELMREWVCTVAAGVGSYCNTYEMIPESKAEAENSMHEIAVSKLIREMLHYITEHYAEPELSLKGIAEELFVNYSYLSAQFKREMGMSASQYILRFRMTKAADAFRNGQENMIEIAGAVGYTDTKYFYRCFKKEFGITPHQYMEILQKSRTINEVL